MPPARLPSGTAAATSQARIFGGRDLLWAWCIWRCCCSWACPLCSGSPELWPLPLPAHSNLPYSPQVALWEVTAAPSVGCVVGKPTPRQHASLPRPFDLQRIRILSRQACRELHLQVTPVLLPGQRILRS